MPITLPTGSTSIPLGENTAANLKGDINMLSAEALNVLTMGNTMFGQDGPSSAVANIRTQNKALEKEKEDLRKGIDKKEAIIERSNRDFSDVRQSLPETQPKKTLHFFEDYTMFFLCISYLFMIVLIIYLYTIQSEGYVIGFVKSTAFCTVISMIIFSILYYLC